MHHAFSSGLNVRNSTTVLPLRCNNKITLSPFIATFHTALQGRVNSRIKSPVRISHNLTVPSLLDESMNLLSNWSDVMELSCAHIRCRQSYFSKSQRMTRPSEPPVTRRFPVSCICPTSEVWPWSRDMHSLHVSSHRQSKAHPVTAFHILTLASIDPVIILEGCSFGESH